MILKTGKTQAEEISLRGTRYFEETHAIETHAIEARQRAAIAAKRAYAREQYKRKLEKNPEDRKKINERVLLRYHKKKAETTPEEKKTRGRPKTKPEKQKMPLGRPRKYTIECSS